ncbi:hypothetical protein [Fructilactobacillus sanfranciscensis]|uniref:hypothetical protein n=1 Tax=Fructilactobacillus sanfranciscensis TaxID=1625 RepID=UPI0026CA0166
MMNKINYEQFNECVYQETLSNGLKVIINPKPDFNSTYASLSVDFGSINTVISKNQGIKHLPAGIAHFIEHKLFDKKIMIVVIDSLSMGQKIMLLLVLIKLVIFFQQRQILMTTLKHCWI